MNEEISQLGKDLRAIREEILEEERNSHTSDSNPEPDTDNTPLDLGPVEAYLEQGGGDYYLSTYHPLSIKYLSALVKEVKRLRDIIDNIRIGLVPGD